MDLNCASRELIEGWQRSFPLLPRPFQAMADAIGSTEAVVMDEIRELTRAGILSRVGATVRPNTVGASLLAAMRIAPEDLERIAAIVSSEPCVNHNYEREHAFNLWFVVTAPDRRGLDAALARLRDATGHEILELPMERPYYLDLGFPLERTDGTWKRAVTNDFTKDAGAVEAEDRLILAAIEDGLEIESRPFASVARRCGLSEETVIRRLGRLIDGGIISRFGLIVRHRPLGISANAMTVWDIPDEVVDEVGQRLADEACVTLCYRRPRRLPDWPYNLFAMVHGRERTAVERQIAEVAARLGLDGTRRDVLFSRRCFAQRGARFKAA